MVSSFHRDSNSSKNCSQANFSCEKSLEGSILAINRLSLFILIISKSLISRRMAQLVACNRNGSRDLELREIGGVVS